MALRKSPGLLPVPFEPGIGDKNIINTDDNEDDNNDDECTLLFV